MNENEKKAIKSLKLEIEKIYSITDFKLFGSKATGNYSSESDIDVMIVLDQVNPRIEAEIDALVFGINLKYDCLISTVIFSKDEIINGLLAESPLYKNIIKNGVPV